MLRNVKLIWNSCFFKWCVVSDLFYHVLNCHKSASLNDQLRKRYKLVVVRDPTTSECHDKTNWKYYNRYINYNIYFRHKELQSYRTFKITHTCITVTNEAQRYVPLLYCICFWCCRDTPQDDFLTSSDTT